MWLSYREEPCIRSWLGWKPLGGLPANGKISTKRPKDAAAAGTTGSLTLAQSAPVKS
jgi:hypothetical protein